MAQLLISVKDVGLPEGLCHVLGEQLLLCDLNADTLLFLALLLLADAGFLDLLERVLLLRLEANLAIQGLLGTLADSSGLLDKARIGRTVLVVPEGVLMAWLGTEPSRRGQFYKEQIRQQINLLIVSGSGLNTLLISVMLCLRVDCFWPYSFNFSRLGIKLLA